MKFGRRYKLTIDMENGDKIIVENPFTINFSVERSLSTTMNTMRCAVMNLASGTREKIFQDFFLTNEQRFVTFEAGYDNLSTIFKGTIKNAYSERIGTEIATTIEAFDSGFDIQTQQTSITLKSGTTVRDIIKYLMGEYKNLKIGSVGDFQGILPRAATLDGNTFYLLQKYTNNFIYCDLRTINALKINEYIKTSYIPLFNKDTGLLETPRREEGVVSITTLFAPEIIIGQLIEFASDINRVYNGQYKVLGVVHEGTISDAVGGQCISRFDLLLGTKYFPRLNAVDPEN